MPLEFGRGNESTRAQAAGEWLFISMPSHMDDEMTFQTEFARTLVARKRPLARVRPNVLLKLRSILKISASG